MPCQRSRAAAAAAAAATAACLVAVASASTVTQRPLAAFAAGDWKKLNGVIVTAGVSNSATISTRSSRPPLAPGDGHMNAAEAYLDSLSDASTPQPTTLFVPGDRIYQAQIYQIKVSKSLLPDTAPITNGGHKTSPFAPGEARDLTVDPAARKTTAASSRSKAMPTPAPGAENSTQTFETTSTQQTLAGPDADAALRDKLKANCVQAVLKSSCFQFDVFAGAALLNCSTRSSNNAYKCEICTKTYSRELSWYCPDFQARHIACDDLCGPREENTPTQKPDDQHPSYKPTPSTPQPTRWDKEAGDFFGGGVGIGRGNQFDQMPDTTGGTGPSGHTASTTDPAPTDRGGTDDASTDPSTDASTDASTDPSTDRGGSYDSSNDSPDEPTAANARSVPNDGGDSSLATTAPPDGERALPADPEDGPIGGSVIVWVGFSSLLLLAAGVGLKLGRSRRGPYLLVDDAHRSAQSFDGGPGSGGESDHYHRQTKRSRVTVHQSPNGDGWPPTPTVGGIVMQPLGSAAPAGGLPGGTVHPGMVLFPSMIETSIDAAISAARTGLPGGIVHPGMVLSSSMAQTSFDAAVACGPGVNTVVAPQMSHPMTHPTGAWEGHQNAMFSPQGDQMTQPLQNLTVQGGNQVLSQHGVICPQQSADPLTVMMNGQMCSTMLVNGQIYYSVPAGMQMRQPHTLASQMPAQMQMVPGMSPMFFNNPNVGMMGGMNAARGMFHPGFTGVTGTPTCPNAAHADPEPPNKLRKLRHLHKITVEEWPMTIDTACRAIFSRLDFKNDPNGGQAILARITAGVHADTGAAQRGCFLVRRHSTSGEGGKVKSPFQILVGGSRILAQKALFAQYNRLMPMQMGTWQVYQKCCHNDNDWWCFEPSHLKRCHRDHIGPQKMQPIPAEPHAIYRPRTRNSRKQQERKPSSNFARNARKPSGNNVNVSIPWPSNRGAAEKLGTDSSRLWLGGVGLSSLLGSESSSDTSLTSMSSAASSVAFQALANSDGVSNLGPTPGAGSTMAPFPPPLVSPKTRLPEPGHAVHSSPGSLPAPTAAAADLDIKPLLAHRVAAMYDSSTNDPSVAVTTDGEWSGAGGVRPATDFTPVDFDFGNFNGFWR